MLYLNLGTIAEERGRGRAPEGGRGRLIENGSLKYWYILLKKYQGAGDSKGARTKNVLVHRT